MISSFVISQFKAFAHVELDQLRRVNLIVGANNAGKSCILEAMRLWSANGSPFVIQDLLRAHDVDTSSFRRRRRAREEELDLDELLIDQQAENPIRFLFHGFHYKVDRDVEIRVGPRGEEDQLKLSLGTYKTIRSEEGVPRRIKVGPSMFSDYESESELVLEIRYGNSRPILYPTESLLVRRGMLRANISDDIPLRPVTIVGTSGVSSTQVAQLWDRVSLTPDQERVLECLRLVESRIDGLTLISEREGAHSSERIPVVSLRGNRGRFPLKTMGDGVTRLFHIALAMVNARGGFVLIDEFENGLYWDVQNRLWPLVFQFAAEFNVQVFATSHSTDCMKGFLKATEHNPSSGSLYRVERFDGSAGVRRIPTLNATDALEAGVEIR